MVVSRQLFYGFFFFIRKSRINEREGKGVHNVTKSMLFPDLSSSLVFSPRVRREQVKSERSATCHTIGNVGRVWILDINNKTRLSYFQKANLNVKFNLKTVALIAVGNLHPNGQFLLVRSSNRSQQHYTV